MLHNNYFRFLRLILLASALTTSAASDPYDSTPTDINSAPHLVSLRYKKDAQSAYEHRCSGTIYSSTVVLTTAVCLVGLEPARILIIAGTSYRSQSDGYVYRVNNYRLHPDFDIWFMNNDLALVHLAFPLIANKPKIVDPIAIAATQAGAGLHAQVAGWGTTSRDEVSTVTEQLQLESVEIVGDAVCKQSYGEARITAAMLCAGSLSANGGYIDACTGDAGSALVADGVAVGLASWGSGCGRHDFPGVYTNLAYFKKWIEAEVEKF